MKPKGTTDSQSAPPHPSSSTKKHHTWDSLHHQLMLSSLDTKSNISLPYMHWKSKMQPNKKHCVSTGGGRNWLHVFSDFFLSKYTTILNSTNFGIYVTNNLPIWNKASISATKKNKTKKTNKLINPRKFCWVLWLLLLLLQEFANFSFKIFSAFIW